MPTVASIAPDLSLAEQVQLEALTHCRRAHVANGYCGVLKGPGAPTYRMGERLKRIAAQLDREDEQERKRLAEEKLRVPSGLIAEMRSRWPEQDAAVRQLAAKLSLPLGEAWARVIAAGVESVSHWEA